MAKTTIERPVFIAGPAGHGKTTLRKALCALTGRTGGSCSDFVYVVWSLISGRSEVELRQMPKEEARPKLVALGNWLTTPSDNFLDYFPHGTFGDDVDPSRVNVSGFGPLHESWLISASIQNGVSILDGIRRRREFEHALSQLHWVGIDPLTIWVEDPRKPLSLSDNLDLHRGDMELGVNNSGSVEDLEEQARGLVKKFSLVSESDA